MELQVDMVVAYCDVCLIAIASSEQSINSDMYEHHKEEHPETLVAYFTP